MRFPLLPRLAAIGLAFVGASLPAGAQAYKVNNLISDGSVTAAVTDPNFINPWAISSSPTWWMSTAGSGMNFVVAAAGTISFRVVIPAASGLPTATGLPAGSVTTAGASGMLLTNGTKASFIFSTLDGTIAGWNSKLGTAGAICTTMINNSAAGASYPGLAILNANATTSYILAANFGTGNGIEVYDSTFQKTALAGSFKDPNLPSGYAPFSVHILGTQIFVAYAQRTATAPFLPVTGTSTGVVDIFDVNGNFVSRAVTGGNLNAPWGVAYAPANFGVFSNDLLIGNFGDGKINAYDPKTFAYQGQLVDSTGKSLTYLSLWELLTGGTAVGNTTSVSGGDTSTVYFTAGLASEAHGLFGGITSGTVSGAGPTYGFTASTGTASVNDGSSVQVGYNIVPVNGFSGSLNLACNNLPAGASCSFTSNPVTVSATGITTGTVTIQTTKASARLLPPALGGRKGEIALAILFPAAGLLLFRRRGLTGKLAKARLFSACLLLLTAGSFLAGCGNNTTAAPVVPTPTGTTTVTIAASGAASQSTNVALTVK
ncbi:MAG TPA: TIGR03118 family protein [Acidobacteriaceae bacterium]|jgi:uncharacterized protein (TIGR03118 family)